MKTLMIARENLYTDPGGDTTQIEMTAKYLRRLGVVVDINVDHKGIDYSKYDLLHFFNLIRPDDILPHISKAKIPYVVSTIFVDYYEYESNNRSQLWRIFNKVLGRDRVEYIKALARAVKNGSSIKSRSYLWSGHRKSISKIIRGAALLLSSSHHEYERLKAVYHIDHLHAKVVNAIDPTIFKDDVPPAMAYDGDVICVGRIEGLKNQLNLIKAMVGTGLRLTIIGKPAANHLKYYEECVRIAATDSNIRIIDRLSHQELAAVYKAARVHVLPSWFETTGLSSLEAGVMGCNVVITRKGDTEEYFKNMAYYCDPQDVGSIQAAVLAAYYNPVNRDLQNYIKHHYTWEIAARQTYDAYRAVVN